MVVLLLIRIRSRETVNRISFRLTVVSHQKIESSSGVCVCVCMCACACACARACVCVFYAFSFSKNEIIGLSGNHMVVDSDDLAK